MMTIITIRQTRHCAENGIVLKPAHSFNLTGMEMANTRISMDMNMILPGAPVMDGSVCISMTALSGISIGRLLQTGVFNYITSGRGIQQCTGDNKHRHRYE